MNPWMNQYIRTNKDKDRDFTRNEWNNEWINTEEQISLKLKKTYHRLICSSQIFFKIVFPSCSLTVVEVDVVFQPWWLIERWNTMDVGQKQSQF